MDDVDLSVRRFDEDRWLASRFAPADVRARLVALYALTHEIARTAEIVREPALGDIRLAWWREAIADLYERRIIRAHPALEAYAHAIRETAAPRAPLDAMIDARGKDLEAAPFADWAALEIYLDATAGAVLRLAMALCSETQPADAEAFAQAAGRAWGYAGLLRAASFWRARGRTLLPPNAAEDDLRQRARAAYENARAIAPRLPSALFPAIGYVTFLPRYLRAPEKQPALLWRQAKLIGAAATGKI